MDDKPNLAQGKQLVKGHFQIGSPWIHRGFKPAGFHCRRQVCCLLYHTRFHGRFLFRNLCIFNTDFYVMIQLCIAQPDAGTA